MVSLANSLEGVTPSGTALTQGSGGNTGGASGDFFDTVTIGSGATLVSDNTLPCPRGNLCLKCATGGTAATVFAQWTTSFTGAGVAQAWFRVYVNVTVLPATAWRLIAFNTFSAGTLCAAVQVTSTGAIRTQDAASATVQTTTAVITVNQWFRLEGYVIGSATVGQIECKLFNNPEAVSVTETLTSAATLNTTGNTVGQLKVGQSAGTVASYGPVFFDEVTVNDTGYAGRSASPGPVTLQNTADGGTNASNVTAANTTSGSPWDLVATPASTTTQWSSTRAAHGPLSITIASAAANANYMEWRASLGGQVTLWWRLYLYLTANPAANMRVMQFGPQGGASLPFLRIDTAGKLVMVGPPGTITTSAASIPLNAWFRLEGMIHAATATGQTEVKLFTTADGTVAAETNTSAANLAMVWTYYNMVEVGNSGAATGIAAYWLDDIGVSNQGYLGPAVLAPGQLSRRARAANPPRHLATYR